MKSSYSGALLVATGILFSRIAGLVRMRVLAHFLGSSDAGDAFYAAVKIPNFPQNLLGEGVLSASFIPVYANLVAKGNKDEARKVAGVILSLLTLFTSIVVAIGIVATPLFIDLVAPGFSGDKRDLTIKLVQIIFPATGLLVISAWCLGVLNSHHKFFLPYVAPVVSNAAVVLVLIFFRHETSQSQLAVYAAWGLVLGALLQLASQLPTTLKLVPHLRLSLATKMSSVQEIIKNFIPVVISRGVVQLSAFIDSILASFLPSGAVAALGYAQTIYMLPISLFGISISAAELPSMSQAFGSENFNIKLQKRINSAIGKVTFFVIPSVAAFLVLGDVVAAILFQTGKFDQDTSLYVWRILGGSAIGLLATTLGRLYSSAFYSLRDTRTPLRFSIIRVLLTTALGYLMGLKLPQIMGLQASWGTAGLTASAGIAGWVEFMLLRKKLNSIIGETGVPVLVITKIWIAALASAAVGFIIKLQLTGTHPFINGAVILSVYGVLYFAICALFKITEAEQILKKVFSKFFRK
ncbi:murein biosynthesis integral membrane protein MurJ [Bdellovibrio sp. qaytius]|nr:murein biosynthesis integral membrane protein MurJ [Bdellovibrio sp. qaytius]